MGDLRSMLIASALLLCTSCSGGTKTAPIGSIGALLSRDKETGAVIVKEAPTGLAGESAGLEPGDQVKMINGILVDELDAARIRELLRGPVGSQVELTVLRGNEVVYVAVERASMTKKPTVNTRYEKIE